MEVKEAYEKLLAYCKYDDKVVGLVLGGSRGKSKEFVNKDSDYDVYVIVLDDTREEIKGELKQFGENGFDIRVFTLSEFTNYGVWNSDSAWEMYNFCHQKAIIDKTGEIQKLLDDKNTIPKNKKKEIIEGSLDAYINSLYRSAKNWKGANTMAGFLDATESLPSLLTALFALEDRPKPYNKYLKWELEHFPLKKLPWNSGEFINLYQKIAATGEIDIQKKMFLGIKKLFSEEGYTKSIDGWKGYYFVGD